MGGPGSGTGSRRYAKSTIERQRSIDVRILKERGFLQARQWGTLSWSCNGRARGSANIRSEGDRIVLDYRFRTHDTAAWEPVEQAIYLNYTRCHFGGNRTWLSCPKCSRRVAALYGAGKYFLCRHCHSLAYASQQEKKTDRMMRRARKIRERVGADINLMLPVFIKPKGMHWKTFSRLRREEQYYNNRSWPSWVGRLAGNSH